MVEGSSRISHPRRVGRLSRFTRDARRSARLWLAPTAVFAFVALGGWWSLRTVESELKLELSEEISAILAADVEGLRQWARFQKNLATEKAGDPLVREFAERIIKAATAPGGSKEALRDHPAQQLLRTRLAPALAAHGLSGWVLLDRSFRIIGADDPELIGVLLDTDLAQALRETFDASQLTRPFAAPRLEGDDDGSGIMIASAPIALDEGPASVAFGLRIRPDDGFTRLLLAARMGETGETYAFSESGLMLSQSRFDDELRTLGLLPSDESVRSIHRIQIRDPGGALSEGHRPSEPREAQPLTRMARDAVSRRSGVDVVGYRDYRGTMVIGAWTWVPELHLGVATETDYDEAYQPVRALRTAVTVLLGLLALCGALVAVGVFQIQRLRRSVNEAKQLGQYTLEEKIGEGGMGRVYRASHSMLRRPTALKLLDGDLLDPSTVTRFEREVQLTSALSHPNTIAIYDYGSSPEGIFYYAMEFLEGLTLDELVSRHGPLPESRVIHLLTQVCGSLVEAHSRGFIHRDIKPDNVFLSQRGGVYDFVKVLDFGLVKDTDSADVTLTGMQAVAGTPRYVSPEAIESANAVDARSDLYSLGATAYYLLVGRSPFDGDTALKLFHAHVHLEAERPSARLGREVDGDLEALIMQCLEKDQDRRPQSAVEVRRSLLACRAAGGWNEEQAEQWWQSAEPHVARRHARPHRGGPQEAADSDSAASA